MDNVHCVTLNMCYISMLSQMKKDIPWKMKMNLEEDFVSIGETVQAREEGSRHHQHEDLWRYVQQAPDDISWTIDQAEFDDLFALKERLGSWP